MHHVMHQGADEFGIPHAVGIEIDDLVKGTVTSVVHIGCGERDVAQGGGFKVTVVFGIKTVVIKQIGGK